MMEVNSARLWETLDEMGKIGATPAGGSRRLALSAEDGAARALFCDWARAAGCEVTVDAIGNIFARRPGRDAAAAPVVIGSHLDTVPTGGRFDGVLGVLAGLEALRRLQDEKVETRAPVELVVWTNEEGARFSPLTLGASVFVGDITLDFALSRRDSEGVSVAEALRQIGQDGAAPAKARPFAAYLELHVEQGPLLKEASEDIGVVSGSYNAKYFVATITGEAAHVGPTLMEQRHDAMVGAAALTLEIDRIGRARGRDGRANAPHIELYPNVRGVIPSLVRLSCDVRHADPAITIEMEAELREACEQVARERGVKVDLDQYFEFGPIDCDQQMLALIRDTAAGLDLKSRDMLTVASHDAVVMMSHCPTALFFVPSDTGISHNEREYSTPKQCANGAAVLLNALLKLAN